MINKIQDSFSIKDLELLSGIKAHTIRIWEKRYEILYPYHNKIKQRIKNHELIKYEYVKKYKIIEPCLLLYFSTEPYLRPIREHRFDEYELILGPLR